MYICNSTIVNSFFGKLKSGDVVQDHPQAVDMCQLGYLRKMTDEELKEHNSKETCQDVVKTKVVNKSVETKVVNTKPKRRRRTKK